MATDSKLRRKQIEEMAAQLRRMMDDLDQPPKGWIHWIRSAMELPGDALAQWMGVRQSSLVGIERRETEGTVTLATLQRAAAALECHFVYAFVPKRPIDDMLQRLAENLSKRAEPESKEAREALVADLLAHPAKIWRLMRV